MDRKARDPGKFTRLLQRAAKGDKAAQAQLVDAAYDELRQIAHWLMQSEGNHTLQPTALVNEACLRLARDNALENSPNRPYFFAAASQAMRRILVEAARRRNAKKAGGEFVRQPFDLLLESYQSNGVELDDLDEALEELERLHSRQARVVELKFLYGMTTAETADALAVSITTIESDWRIARAFLYQRLSDDS